MSILSGGEAVAATIARLQGVQPQQQHPLQTVYQRLEPLFSQLPRDGEGNVDAIYARGALALEGLDDKVLSAAGLSRLLAYCDVSPSGFPSFGDFMMCLVPPEQGLQRQIPVPTPSTFASWPPARPSSAVPVPVPPPSVGSSPRFMSHTQRDFRHAAQAAALTVSQPGSLSPEALAEMYARGARLHAGYLRSGLPRHGVNSTEKTLTAEVSARLPGGRAAMPGVQSRPDGYRLDESGSFKGILPGLEQHRGWPKEWNEYREALEDGYWVVHGGPPDPDKAAADGQSGGINGAHGADDGLGGGAHWNWGGRGGAQGVQSDRRARAVAKGEAVVPSPRKAGPATGWRKFA